MMMLTMMGWVYDILTGFCSTVILLETDSDIFIDTCTRYTPDIAQLMD